MTSWRLTALNQFRVHCGANALRRSRPGFNFEEQRSKQPAESSSTKTARRLGVEFLVATTAQQ